MELSATEVIAGDHRKFYQTLMTVTFSLDTGHQYHYILRPMIYIFLLNWTIMVIYNNIISYGVLNINLIRNIIIIHNYVLLQMNIIMKKKNINM